MIKVEKAELVRWQPDLSPSGTKRRPEWFKVLVDGTPFTNALNWLEVDEDNPVQLLICEDCGHTGCAWGNYGHVSRLGDDLLWTPPRLEPFRRPQDDEQYSTAPMLEDKGAIVVPIATWTAWAETVGEELPLPTAVTGPAELRNAWLVEMPRQLRGPHSDVAKSVAAHLVAADSLERTEAIDLVARILATLQSRDDQPAEGRVKRANPDTEIEALYFDLAGGNDSWPALARSGDRWTLAFGRDWIYEPGEGESFG